ncbi:MAG: putative Ig domain-containing protein [Patescibacteria group bacterium]
MPSTIQNGQSVTINGSGFGIKYPVEPTKWDTFDVGLNEALLGSTQPEWIAFQQGGAKYDSTYYHSGPFSVGNKLTPESQWATNYFQFTPTDNIFVSYWWRTAYTDIDDYGITKLTRITSSPAAGGEGIYDGVGTTALTNMNPRYNSIPYLFYQNTSSPVAPPLAELTVPYNEWARIDTHTKRSTAGVSDGSVMTECVGHDIHALISQENCSIGYDYHWDTVLLGLMAANVAGYYELYLDDIYIDTTQARVEIGNTSTWDTNTHREIQIPHTTWNDDQIQFTVNQGTFTNGESAYLYVVDENGVVNTTGYPITFGGIASNIPPVLASIGNKSLHEQETLTINVLASDDDPEDTLTLSASNLPTGATFTDNDGGSGAFSWTPTDQQANIYSNIHFEVTDGTDTDTEDITITVLDGAADCTPAWDCSNWSVCADSIQTRSCHDDNNCGSDAGRPVESAECDSTAPGIVSDLR